MKRALITSIVVFLYVSGGTVQAQLLGHFYMWSRTNIPVITDHIELSLQMQNASGSISNSFLWPGIIHEDLDGHLYQADESMEGFSGIADMLTNGYNDYFFVMQKNYSSIRPYMIDS